tara:strand:- start:438 stop:740 length:303 start_codon:yes stop_codon:yes gene_type:complete
MTKRIEFKITNFNADEGLIFFEGISLMLDVLGLIVSISLSIYLLNAIAADLANTIQRITYIKVKYEILLSGYARKNPITAKGSAQIVWLNLINDKYFFIK